MTPPEARFTVKFAYDAAMVAQMHAAGGRWNKDAKLWTLPASPRAALALATYGLLGDNGNAARVLAGRATEKGEQLERVSGSDGLAEAFPAPIDGMKHYQTVATRYATLAQGRVLVGDDVGLGKTLEALAILELFKTRRAIVACPAAVVLHWKEQAEKWAPHRQTAIVETSPPPPGTEIAIVSLDRLRRLVQLKGREAPEFDLADYRAEAMIVDEAHRIKDGAALRSRAAKTLAQRCDVRLLLTATPILNRPVELVHQLDVLGRLDWLGGYGYFTSRYCDAKTKTIPIRKRVHGRIMTFRKTILDLTGHSHLDELNRELRRVCLVRREREQVEKELPPRRLVTVPMTIDNRRDYEKARDDLAGWLKQIRGLPKRPELLAEELQRIEALKQVVVAGKMAGVLEWAEDFLEGGRRLVLYCTHTAAGGQIAQKLEADFLSGETSPTGRHEMIQRFKRGEKRALVANIKAGGEGIDGLQYAAADMAFVEFGWTWAEHKQAIGRLDRNGQEHPVTAYFLKAGDTIDETIVAQIERKAHIAAAAIQGVEVQGIGLEDGDTLLDVLAARLTEGDA